MTALRFPSLALPVRPGVPFLVLFVAAYIALDRVSHVDPLGPLGITPWNPSPGLALFLLLHYGLRYAPWLFAAAFLAQWIPIGSGAAAWPLLACTAAVIAIGYAGIAVLLTRRLGFSRDLAKLRDVTLFVTTTVVGTLAIALLCVSLFVAAGAIPAELFVSSTAHFWIGDLIGVIVTTPVLLVSTRSRLLAPTVSRMEVAMQIAAFLAALVLIFVSDLGDERKLVYLLFLPQIWIAMRHGVAGTVWATLLAQVGLIVALLVGGHAPGEVLDYQLLMFALALTGLFMGVTLDERRAAESELRAKQSELDRSLRAAAASELASTLAHELNQPLSAVASYTRACQLLLEQGDPAHELVPTLNKVVAEANRAATVVRRLREFVLTGAVRQEPLAVAALLEGTVEAARPRAQRLGVTLSVIVAPALPLAMGDRVQLETVLHNLVANAIDALTGTTGGRSIRIEATVAPPDMVEIAVADDGPGIHTDVSDILFQPMASTKVEGLGLGLAISRSIVEAHGGRLWLEPSARGARFCLTLPTVR
jgi:signal transduction histidine kinase